MEEFDYVEESRLFRIEIEDVERKVDSNLTVLTGDFNMNPFEKGMMAATTIHSYPTKFEASKEKRTVKRREYKMFYNPMWSFFGDNDTPTGTYHYSGASYLNLYWNIFDQVLVRPSLMNNISPKDINILTNIKDNMLIYNGKPSVSDHLPLLFKIK